MSLASPPPANQESRINLENHDDDNFEQAYGNDFETNRRYLSLSWWLLHKGCLNLMEKVRIAVKEVFGTLNPREEITLERLSELTLEVRKKVEGATEAERRYHLPPTHHSQPYAELPYRSCKWLPYLLPSPSQESYVLSESGMTTSPPPSPTTTSSLRHLIDETSDLIDSPAFTHVLTRLLDAAFSHLIDVKISQLAYKIPPLSASTQRVQEIVGSDEVKAKVASSLAVFCRQAHGIGSGANNEYLAAIEQVGELEAFAAVVYSSNFEVEAPEFLGGKVGREELEGAKVEEEGGVEDLVPKVVPEVGQEVKQTFEQAFEQTFEQVDKEELEQVIKQEAEQVTKQETEQVTKQEAEQEAEQAVQQGAEQSGAVEEIPVKEGTPVDVTTAEEITAQESSPVEEITPEEITPEEITSEEITSESAPVLNTTVEESTAESTKVEEITPIENIKVEEGASVENIKADEGTPADNIKVEESAPVDDIKGDDTAVDNTAVQDTAAEASADSGFENAWDKALKKEDGKAH